MNDPKQKIGLAMLRLCVCALKDEKIAPKRLSEAELDELYRFSEFHSLTALVCEGLLKAGYEKSKISAFCTSRDRSVRKNLLLDTERARFFAFCEQNGIWYVPLKGIVLKDMYPKMGLRQMSDNDILFDEAHRARVRDWFLFQGYDVESYAEHIHDVYYKAPVYNYEMHIALYDGFDRSDWHSYYKDVKNRLILSKHSFECRFTDEDFYIYFLSHAFNHFEKKGIGIRFLCDMYVYLKSKGDTLDFEYIYQELKVLGLEGFEKECRELVFIIFENGDFSFEGLSKENQILLTYFLSSGAYGTFGGHAQMEISKKGKLKYLLGKIFPGTDVLKKYHPIFKHKWLIPIGWIYRAFAVLFKHPDKVRKTIKEVEKS